MSINIIERLAAESRTGGRCPEWLPKRRRKLNALTLPGRWATFGRSAWHCAGSTERV